MSISFILLSKLSILGSVVDIIYKTKNKKIVQKSYYKLLLLTKVDQIAKTVVMIK